jgi:hypothetical protein
MIMAPMLLFLGAFVAWISYESHRVKLAAIAVSAPALITTWAGGATSVTKFSLDFIPSAYAAENVTRADGPSIVDGVKLFFGVGKDDSRYHVIVGSFKSTDEAASLVKKVKSEDPTLNVYVGARAPGNDHYPVVVGDYLPYPEALKLKDKVLKFNSVEDAYLSPGWR